MMDSLTLILLLLLLPVVYSASPPFSISQSNEGALTNLNAGDWLAAGLSVSVPGNPLSTSMKLTFTANAQIQVSCNSNPANQICAKNKKISINIPVNPVVTIPAGNTGTFPFGDEKQPGSYQGSLQIPTGLCTGAMTLCQTPTLFVTKVCSDVSNPPSVSIKWHWRDPYAQQPASPSNNIDCSNPTQNSPLNPNATLCGASWSSTPSFTPPYCPRTTTAPVTTTVPTTTTTSLAHGSCNPGAIVGHICAGCPGNS